MLSENPLHSIYFGGPNNIEDSPGKFVAHGGVLYLNQNAELFLKQTRTRLNALTLGSPTPIWASDKHHRDKVSTDEIIRVPDLLTVHIDKLGIKALCGLPPNYGINPNTLATLQGSVLVAGNQFGKGSSREQAVITLQQAGITAILAPSFGPIFERNAAYLGLLTSTNVDLADVIQRGEAVFLDHFLNGKSPLLQKIINAGGIFPYMKGINTGKIEIPQPREHNTPQPMNILEKRLSRVMKTPSVQTGDEFLLPIDRAGSYVVLSGLARAQLLQEYGEIDAKVLPDLFEDHFAYSKTPGVAELTAEQRQFAKELGLPPEKYHYGRRNEGGGKGIIHRVLLETTDPRQTQVVIVTDSHTPTGGALPCLFLPVGSTEFAVGISEGAIPFSTPSVLRVELKGQLPPGTTIRDAQLEIAARFKQLLKDHLVSETKVVEFGGLGLQGLTFNQVAALGNMVPEVFNAEMAVTEAYEAGIVYLMERWGMTREEALDLYDTPDTGCKYTHTIEFDLSKTTPWIALPSDPTNGRPLSELSESPTLQKAYIASCTNGLDELREAAAVLLGKNVHPHTEFIVVPSSQAVYDEAEKRGYLQILRDAGVIVHHDIACRACIGDSEDAVQPGEIAISATNRNFPGRMDPSKEGRVYLAGSLLVAVSALLGHIPSEIEYQTEVPSIIENLGSLS